MAERIIEANVLQDYQQCKAAYGLYVNTIRAVPGIRDGLKTVTRASLMAAFQLRAFNSFKYKFMRWYYALSNEEKAKFLKDVSGQGKYKSARLVGDTLGKFHPHGDSSVYDNVKKNINDFEINHPVYQWQGNWGNAYGDSQAAMRYTETRISEFGMDCVIGDLIDCNIVVDWKDNFDYKEKIVEYFPVKLGLLLVNGAFGIGVGIQCSIPSHNLAEVVDAHIKLLENPDSPIVLIPDFPMGCDIVETNWKAIANTGKGKFLMRANIDIEEIEGYTCLVIKSLPERTFMKSIEEKIINLIKEKKLLQIEDLRYSKPEEGQKEEEFRYIIELKKGADPNYVREFLFKNTALQQTFSVSFEVLDDLNPEDIHRVRLSQRDYLLFMNEQIKLNKFRLYNRKIQEIDTKVNTRAAFIQVLESGKLDEFLAIIRRQNTTNDNTLIEELMKATKITPLQARYIINIPAKKFSEGYLRQYIEDNKGLEENLEFYEARILDESLLVEDIKRELLEIKRKYGRPRKSKVIKESEVSGIPEGEFKLIITETNFVKKMNLSDNINIKGDMIKTVMKVDNIEAVLLFDEQGKVFRLPIHEVPLGDKSTPPIDIRTILKNATSNINTVIYEPILKKVAKLKVYHFITVMTERCIKKLDIADFLAVSKSGLKYHTLGDGDKVIDVSIVADGLDILTYSRNKALRMNISEVPHMKRVNMGMKIMDSPEPIEGLSVLSPTMTHIVVVTEKGKVNKISIFALPLSSRGKTGSNVIKLAKGDAIRDIHGMNEEDTLKVITKNETVELKLADISEGSSISAGVSMIKIVQGDCIIKCELI